MIRCSANYESLPECVFFSIIGMDHIQGAGIYSAGQFEAKEYLGSGENDICLADGLQSAQLYLDAGRRRGH